MQGEVLGVLKLLGKGTAACTARLGNFLLGVGSKRKKARETIIAGRTKKPEVAPNHRVTCNDPSPGGPGECCWYNSGGKGEGAGGLVTQQKQGETNPGTFVLK